MFGRKCSLCGGKLNSSNVCKECGLDNTKSDKYYKINQSTCDNKPLTHAHKDTMPETKVKNKTKPLKDKSSKRTSGKVISIVIALAAFVPAILGLVDEVMTPVFETVEIDTEMMDPYEYLENIHPEEGESISYSLGSGQYIVGMHIAEGNYTATTFDDFDTIEVMDFENGIYLYEYQAKEEEDYLDDLRLFNGAVVTIMAKEEILINTQNAQVETQTEGIDNPVVDTFELESGNEAEAGRDFEPGIYDVIVEDDYTYLSVTIYDEEGNEWNYLGLDIGKEGSYGQRFDNLALPEGAVLYTDVGDVTLIPSERIASTDYLGFYY